MSKKPIQSKTLWFNGLLVASSVGTALLADENFRILIGNNIETAGAIVGVIGILLRLVTGKQIEITKF